MYIIYIYICILWCFGAEVGIRFVYVCIYINIMIYLPHAGLKPIQTLGWNSDSNHLVFFNRKDVRGSADHLSNEKNSVV